MTNPSDPVKTRTKAKLQQTGFHSETLEAAVEQLLKETLTEMRMSMKNERIECPGRPMTHAFIYF